LPSWELFDVQPEDYRESVLPSRVKVRVSIEAAATLSWEKYIGSEGIAIGINRFGASAPYQKIYEELGLTARHMAEEAERLLKRG
jgi:transketolase